MGKKQRKKALRSAFALADVVFARLDERGIPQACWPSRDAVLVEVYPLARRLVKSQALAATAARTQHAALWLAAAEESTCAARLDRITGRLADVQLPDERIRLARSVEFRPADWTVSLTPAARVPRAREAA